MKIWDTNREARFRDYTLNFSLFFTVQGGLVSCFSFFLNYSRGGGAPLFIYFDFFYC